MMFQVAGGILLALFVLALLRWMLVTFGEVLLLVAPLLLVLLCGYIGWRFLLGVWNTLNYLRIHVLVLHEWDELAAFLLLLVLVPLFFYLMFLAWRQDEQKKELAYGADNEERNP